MFSHLAQFDKAVNAWSFEAQQAQSSAAELVQVQICNQRACIQFPSKFWLLVDIFE